jgi:hypothetical protein
MNAELRLLAKMFSDVQEFRKATENKVRSATVDPAFIGTAIAHYKAVEHELSLQLRRALRRTAAPGILAWQKKQQGVGEHLLARLLGDIGTPRLAEPKHWEGTGKGDRVLVSTGPRRRTISQLWSYCGHGDPARKLRKDMSAEEVLAVGNRRTKAIVWNLAGACVKAGVRKLADVDDSDGYDLKHREAVTHYGQVYLDRRFATLTRIHAEPCVRCGPKGKPAAAGTPWSTAHRHADAMRIVGKEILRDLWKAAR